MLFRSPGRNSCVRWTSSANRGYGILEKDSCVIKSVKDLKKDDIIDLRLTDGNAQAKVL